MKFLKWLILVIILLVALAFGGLYWWSVEQSPPDALNQHQPPTGLAPEVMNPVLGEYLDREGRRVMLLPSAAGGLQVHPADDFVPGNDSSPIEQMTRDEDGSWWVELADGRRQPVEMFTRVGRVAEIRWPDHRLKRVQDPLFQALAVEYSSDLQLSGTIFLPESGKPVPGAVIIHGSGSSDRDNAWYLQLARALVVQDVAVLLPDKRGSGRSAGEWRTASFGDLAKDALAAHAQLDARPEVAAGKVGFLGVSQGGRVAPLAAIEAGDAAAFSISLSTAAVTPREQVRHEIRQQALEKGVPPWLVPAMMPILERMPPRRRPAWWQKNGDIDPLDALRRLQAPALVMYGREDEKDNVPVSDSVSRLVGLGKPDSALKLSVVEGVGHSLQDPASGELLPRVRDELAEWIHGVADIPDPVASACKGVLLDIDHQIAAQVGLSEWEARVALETSRNVMLDSAYAATTGMDLLSARDVGYVGSLRIGNADPQVPSFATGLEVDVGGVTKTVPAALVVDLRGAHGASHADIDGLLGVDAFEEFVLDINLPGRCLRLIPRDRFRAPPGAITVKRRNDRPVVDAHVEFPGGRKFDILLLLDFGLAETVRFDKSFVDDNALLDVLETTEPTDMDAGPAGEASGLRSEAGLVSVGNSIWTDVSVGLAREVPGDGVSPPWQGAIGIELLKTRRVVYDPSEGRLWLIEPR